MSPLPRYLVGGYCQDEDHMPDRQSPDFKGQDEERAA
jgi:hypothetical protein